MSSVAAVIRNEIVRLARRQVRAEVEPLKKQRVQQRQTIASLREEVASLRRELSALRTLAAKQGAGAAAAAVETAAEKPRRFSPTRLRQMRERLGLSRREIGLLIGTTEQSLYNWESGSARPRPQMIAALAQVREGGKRAALKRLAELDEGQQEKPAAESKPRAAK